MNILDDARSFTSLWSKTRDFIPAYSKLIHTEADLEWLLDSETGYEYDNCQFFSNFEIGGSRFFRSKENENTLTGWTSTVASTMRGSEVRRSIF